MFIKATSCIQGPDDPGHAARKAASSTEVELGKTQYNGGSRCPEGTPAWPATASRPLSAFQTSAVATGRAGKALRHPSPYQIWLVTPARNRQPPVGLWLDLQTAGAIM